eukprot:jgi/Undpi1/8796/HiC_scaffold_25.g11258.m1
MGAPSMLVKVCICTIIFLSGLCKLTPKWGEDVHAAMDETFRDRFIPSWQQMFFLSSVGVELNATLVKLAFGSVEVVSAVMLFTPYKLFASVVLFGMMSAIALTHLFLGEFSHIPMPLFLCVSSLWVSFLGVNKTGL